MFATINDFVFFQSTPNTLSLIGTLIIMSSAVYIAVSSPRGFDGPCSPRPQISKKDPIHKREQDIVLNSADQALEEGLLDNQEHEDEPFDIHPKDKAVIPVNPSDSLEAPRWT